MKPNKITLIYRETGWLIYKLTNGKNKRLVFVSECNGEDWGIYRSLDDMFNENSPIDALEAVSRPQMVARLATIYLGAEMWSHYNNSLIGV